jgi:hypothetical protein
MTNPDPLTHEIQTQIAIAVATFNRAQAEADMAKHLALTLANTFLPSDECAAIQASFNQ